MIGALALYRKDVALFVVAYLWLGSIALTAARVDVGILQPNAAGPRGACR